MDINVRSEDRRTVRVGGRYRHFKGNEYIVLHLAKDSETLAELVVYRDCQDEGKVWVRPLVMFLEQVTRDGVIINRFDEVNKN